MRHCFNETVHVYETHDNDLATCLREVAQKVDEHKADALWFSVQTERSLDMVWTAILYVHY